VGHGLQRRSYHVYGVSVHALTSLEQRSKLKRMSVINSGSLKKLTEIAIVFTQDFGKPRLAIAPERICGSASHNALADLFLLQVRSYSSPILLTVQTLTPLQQCNHNLITYVPRIQHAKLSPQTSMSSDEDKITSSFTNLDIGLTPQDSTVQYAPFGRF
jgi:hypothetical protein